MGGGSNDDAIVLGAVEGDASVVSCLPKRVYHSWKARLPMTSVFRAWNVRLDADPSLRLCDKCGAQGRVSDQGVVSEIEWREKS